MVKKSVILVICGVIMAGCLDKNIPDYSIEKFNVDGKIPYKYNVYRDLRGCDNNTILYYMHGFQGDENTWYESNKIIINEWRKSGKPSPVVIGITFGDEWLLIPKNAKKEKSGYLELFVNKIMPAIEKQVNSHITRRYIMGFSMGGANSAQLLFRYPELFEKGVLISPNVFPISVFSNQETINEFARLENSRIPGLKNWIRINFLGIDRLKESVYYHFAKYQSGFVPDPKTWDKIDIIKNMKKPPRNKIVKLYLSCGDTDLNGFYPGAEKLALKAKSLSYSVIWETLHGGHMVSNQNGVAAFLLE